MDTAHSLDRHLFSRSANVIVDEKRVGVLPKHKKMK